MSRSAPATPVPAAVEDAMGLLTFTINVTLDGCVDHQEGIANDETHAFFTRLMDESGAMLWGRVTYEMMESYWPAVARGDEEAPPAMREWAVKLEAKPKYVVSSTRKDFPWTNATTSPATCARACKSSRTRPRPACSSVAASSRPSWTGWI
jgi:dihydrofolate reductase